MNKKATGYEVFPFPKIRRLMVDGGYFARQKHVVHGLVEFDVTCARQLMREHKLQTGETLSFTAFLITCLGRAVDANRRMQSLRTWRDKLVVYDDVDINTMFEVEVDGVKVIRPHIIRAANSRTYQEVHTEIRDFQTKHASGKEAKFIDRFVLLPQFLRRTMLALVFKNPHLLKEMNGTVSLTSIGMFGTGCGWGLPASSNTLQITVGGMQEKPRLINGQLENREYVSITISFDHDLVDGAPAARFTQRFRELVESGWGLRGELAAPGNLSSG